MNKAARATPVPTGKPVVGQALYTWASATLTGPSGVGFVAASPSLRDRLGWLQRLQPDAFEVRLEAVLAPSSRSVGGFSYVGRIVRADTAIVFCKTDAAVHDAKQRPQPLVHALFSEDPALDLWALRAIPSGWWLRQLPGGVMPNLNDVNMAALIPDSARSLWASHELTHDCSRTDGRAARLLDRFAATTGNERQVEFMLGHYPELLDDLLLVVPMAAWGGIELAHFEQDGAIIARVGLRVPELHQPSQVGSQLAGCRIVARVAAAAPLLFSRTGGDPRLFNGRLDPGSG